MPTKRINPFDAATRLKNLIARKQTANGLFQVDDVNQVALAVDVRLHLGVPSADPVAVMNPGFDEILDNKRHEKPSGYSMR